MRITHLLKERTAAGANVLAYRFLPNDRDEVTLTYGQLFEGADRLARKLSQKVTKGQRVLLLYPAGLEFITAFFACLLARTVPVPLPLPKANDPMHRLDHVLRDCDPALILTVSSVVCQICTQLPDTYHSMVAPTDVELSIVEPRLSSCVADADIALLQYTSGSTSQPKGVVLSDANLLANLSQIEQAFGHSRDSSGVIWLPHFHDMGLIGGLLEPLFVGFPVTLFSPVSFMQRPLRWLRAIDKYRATTSGGPNFAYDLCVAKAQSVEDLDIDLSCWQVAFNGAEPVKSSTLAAFSKTFAKNNFRSSAFLPCYGLAEATLLVSAAKIDSEAITVPSSVVSEPDRPVSCGVPAQGMTVQILRVNCDLPCHEGEVGELSVKGPSVSRGYWGYSPHEDSAIRSIGLRTGDLGYLLGGELFITSRLKDLIIIRGKNLFPEDVEETVKEAQPLLKMEGAAAIGVPSRGGEDLVFVQEVSARTLRVIDLTATLEAVKNLVLERHGVNLRDFLPVPAGSLVRTSSGKISRSACRRLYINQHFTPLPIAVTTLIEG